MDSEVTRCPSETSSSDLTCTTSSMCGGKPRLDSSMLTATESGEEDSTCPQRRLSIEVERFTAAGRRTSGLQGGMMRVRGEHQGAQLRGNIGYEGDAFPSSERHTSLTRQNPPLNGRLFQKDMLFLMACIPRPDLVMNTSPRYRRSYFLPADGDRRGTFRAQEGGNSRNHEITCLFYCLLGLFLRPASASIQGFRIQIATKPVKACILALIYDF